jgi:hypothetical protein
LQREYKILRDSKQTFESRPSGHADLPGDPIGTLDAIHLASLLVARSAIIGLGLLSLDERVRQAAKGLGVAVEPS